MRDEENIKEVAWVQYKMRPHLKLFQGIDEENKLKIFEPRFTTKSSGMGLGLSIISNIVKSFGGSIEFETKMNIGTTFTITLPKN